MATLKRILVFIFAFFLVKTSVAQQPQALGSANTRIIVRGQLQIDSLFVLPGRVDTNFVPYKAGAIVYRLGDARLYYHDGSTWRPIFYGATISETDPTVSAAIKNASASDTTRWGKLYVDSIKRSSDSVYYYVGGVRFFGFKDSTSNISGKIDSVKRKVGSDSVFYYRGATQAFAFRDSIGTGEIATGTNVGSGGQVFQSKVGVDFRFRTLIAANTNLTISQNTNDLTLQVKNFVDSVRKKSGTDSIFFYSGGVGSFAFRDSSIAGGEINTASNVGSGVGVFKTKSGVDLQFKSLTSDTTVAITGNTNNVEIKVDQTRIASVSRLSDTAAAIRSAIGSGGGTADSISKPGYASKWYVDSVFNSGDTLTIHNSGATGVSLARGSGDSLYFKKLVAGTGMTLTLNSDSSVTVTSTVTGGVDTATISTYYFKDGGNNFSAAANIGTNTAQDLRFKVGNIETMRLNQSNGQLLVGTTTPVAGYKMLVGGHFQVNSGFDIWAAGGIRLAGSFLGTSTTGNIFRNLSATSQSTKNIMWSFENSAPTASSGTRQQILMNLYKLINRGTSGFDSTETVLRVDANVTGTATDVRGIWQTYGTNLFNTSYGSTYIGYDSTAKNNFYKFNVNGSIVQNKDSLPILSTIGSNYLLTIDTTTGQYKRIASLGGGGGTPGGSNTQVQFNNSGAFGGSANFTWNNASNALGLGSSGTTAYLNLAAGTTSKALFNFGTGAATSSPSAGDFWFDVADSSFKYRVGSNSLKWLFSKDQVISTGLLLKPGAGLVADTLMVGGGTAGQALISNGSTSAATWTDLPAFAEGTYTATITNVTNVGTSSITTANYTRHGSYIEVFGEITIDPTATGDTHLRITLPISSSISNTYDLSGQATTYDNNQSIRIYGDTTNSAAIFRLNASVDASSHVYSFRFIYKYTAP